MSTIRPGQQTDRQTFREPDRQTFISIRNEPASKQSPTDRQTVCTWDRIGQAERQTGRQTDRPPALYMGEDGQVAWQMREEDG